MKLHLQHPEGRNFVRAYGAGEIIINETRYTTSLILTPDAVSTAWEAEVFADLTAGHFQALAELDPEVVIVGTGMRLRFPDAGHTRPLITAQIGFEIMDTAAACRTYNVLMGEGRKVAAGLLLPDAG